MTAPTPIGTTPSNPVSPKVSWGAAAGYLAAVAVLAIINAVQDDASLIDFLPAAWEAILVPLLPALAAFLAGYAKRDPLRDVGRAVAPARVVPDPRDQGEVGGSSVLTVLLIILAVLAIVYLASLLF